MFIKYLRMVNNIWLLLSNVKEVTFDFTSNQQLILGSNGCGKTTILRSMSILPPNQKHYREGGYEEVIAEHQGKTYRVTSTMVNKKMKHEFFVDQSENLNPGGTLVIQRQLVEAHTGLTQDLFDILVGSVKFSEMAALRRREWIMRISGDDLEYAMRVHARLKEKLRDATAVLKYNQTKLANLSEDESHDLEQMEKELAMLADEIQVLQLKRINGIRSLEENRRLQEKAVFEVTSELRELNATNLNKPDDLLDFYFDSVDSIKTEKTKLATQLEIHRKNYLQSLEDLEKKQMLKTAIGDDTTFSSFKLKKQIEDLCGYINKTLKPQLNDRGMLTSAQGQYRTFIKVKDELLNKCDHFPPNRDNYLNKETLMEKYKNKSILEKRLTTAQLTLQSVAAQLEKYHNTADVTCPSCETSFNPLLTKDALCDIELTVQQNEHLVGALKIEIEEHETYINDCNHYRQALSELRGLYASHRELSSLWLRLDELGYQYVAASFTTAIQTFEGDLLTCIKIEETQAQISDLETTLERALGFEKANEEGLQNTITSLENKVKELTGLINIGQTQLTKVNGYLKTMENFEVRHSAMKDKLQRLDALFKEGVLSAVNSCVERMIIDKQIQMATLAKSVNEIKTKQSMINEVNLEIDKHSKICRHLELLIKGISPTEGLIAKRISVFINCFVAQINEIISHVWTYPIEVQPCGFTSGEVDYKFPVSVKNSPVPAEDIKNCSSGQVDMIDLTFRLVLLMYLDMPQFPLYLDELAPTLDEQHRINILAFIKSLMDKGEVSQMFMISHYVSNHAAFVNAEFCVLEATNIVNMPKVYNKHSTIRYCGV